MSQTKEAPSMSKNLIKVKARILKSMGDPQGTYERKEYNQINNLDGYPTHSSQLRGISVKHKSPIMKAHLNDAFPNNKWSVRSEYYSGGSAIQAYWKGEGSYPYGASDQIAALYSNSGSTNSQVDYFDVDNYVSLFDDRENRHLHDPQTLAKSRETRLSQWIRDSIQPVTYDQRCNWSAHAAKELIENGKFTPFSDMTETHKDQVNKTWNSFQEQEQKENGTGETLIEQATSNTPAFHTQQYMSEDPKKPNEIPIDPKTGKELPVSKYNPLKEKCKVSDVTTETPSDVDRAHRQMLAEKANLDKAELDEPEPNTEPSHTDKTSQDSMEEKIKNLYSLGHSGQYEIVQRTVWVISMGLNIGKNSKECMDKLRDKGIKPLELSISLAIALKRTAPNQLNEIDQKIRIQVMRECAKLIKDFEKLESQNP